MDQDFFSPELDEERYGLIVMSEFLEHVPHPSRFLVRAHELLVPNGVVYLTTPNFGSFERHLCIGTQGCVHSQAPVPSGTVRRGSEGAEYDPWVVVGPDCEEDHRPGRLGKWPGRDPQGHLDPGMKLLVRTPCAIVREPVPRRKPLGCGTGAVCDRSESEMSSYGHF